MDQGEGFDGVGADILSSIDTAMDAFSPDADAIGPYDIDETQLRIELTEAVAKLRLLGLVD
jgi:hypothetical protein